MPRGDGTGPTGQGPRTGRGGGLGRGAGQGRGLGGGNRKGAGVGGKCVCPNCKTTIPHKVGIPCYSMKCPKCGTQMIRG